MHSMKRSVAISEVIYILENPPTQVLTNPPQRPKAHELHVYVFAETAEKEGMFI